MTSASWPAPAERTAVHLLRHGEVENPTGVLYGRLPDFHLSQLGQEMAERVGKHLADHDITVVVASSLERAQETAAPVAQAHGISVTTDDRVIEAENYFQGMTFGRGDGSLSRPQHWRRLVNPFRPSWGEPYVQLAQRMLAAIDDVRESARGHEAVIVSHQLPIWITHLSVAGLPLRHDPRRRRCALSSVTSFELVDDVWREVAYAEPATTAGAVDVGAV